MDGVLRCVCGWCYIRLIGMFLSVLSVANGSFCNQESKNSPISEILRFFLVVA